MADRSPNFPSVSLSEAIDMIRLVYQREGRSKMPRMSAVKPLGYSSINGRSLSILGALRAYGLLDGRGDEVRVSDDAITILNAPHGSAERKEALLRAFEGPPSFALLRSKGDASPDTLRWHLIKSNFRDDSADKLIKVYLESRDLINAEAAEYDTDGSATDAVSEPPRLGDIVRWESQGVVQFEDRRVLGFSDDGAWAFVEDSQTGIPIGELEIVERAPPAPPAPRGYIGVPPTSRHAPRSMHARDLSMNGYPDFVVKLGDGIVALIEIKGGEATPRHLAKLERFIQLQKELIEDEEGDGVWSDD